MRILFLSDNFPPESNAPASRLFEHARRWVTDGHQVTVMTGAPNFPEGKVYPGFRNVWRHVEEQSGIRVVRVKTYITANEGFFRRTMDYISFAVSGCLFGIFERRPDLIVATTPQFFCALGGYVLSVLRRVPFVLELRDLWPASIVAVGAMREGRLIRMLERLELFLYRRSDVIVTVTQSFRADLISRGIDPDKIHVVPNGTDLSWCRMRPRDAELEAEFSLTGKFVVGYVGTHGMAHALPASWMRQSNFAIDRTSYSSSSVTAPHAPHWNKGYSRQPPNVRLVPRMPKEMIGRLWSLCDVSLMPLKDDPLFATVIPSKLFEAMGHGIPTLASMPEGEATAIVRSTGCGLVVQPENPTKLARAVESLADDREQLLRYREAALAAAPQYSRQRLAKDMARVFDGVLQEANPVVLRGSDLSE